ncbi:MAG: gamma-glutamyl-gamma-aminobutyrate hydrolase family protein [Armatimonadota bacterium]|nr:gamma-glutamyl-gamma-aminobutyrate hydrolase family protein [Armatimonadota bacterium]
MMRPHSKPLVGITTGTHPQWREGGDYFESYAEPLRLAGAECVPLVGTSAFRRVEDCHGVLLSGGWDVHPDHYARLPGDEHLSSEDVIRIYGLQCEPERDEYELPAAKRAVEIGLPILAICRGIQLLNIILAGKLVPDIEKCVPGALRHRALEGGVSACHEVVLQPGSIVQKSYGRTVIVVNSRHHQGLLSEMIPSGFTVSARSSDGVVEAIESLNSHFIVGVQWHPERQQDPYIFEPSIPLFEAFIEACKQRMSGRTQL